jgi:hypothetical protein
MRVQTSRYFEAECEQLWPLLTSSQMTASGYFCLGVPRPLYCELPGQQGGVGAERRCVSDRGTVIQEITGWDPPERLRFRMVSTDHDWGRWIASIDEEFVLQPSGQGTQLTRTTRCTARGPGSTLKERMLWFGLKRVHLYVFANWQRERQ